MVKHDIFSEENRLSPPCRKRVTSPALSIFGAPSERDHSSSSSGSGSSSNSNSNSNSNSSNGADGASFGSSNSVYHHRNTALCLRNSGASAKESSTSPLTYHPHQHHHPHPTHHHQHHQRLYVGGGARRQPPVRPAGPDRDDGGEQQQQQRGRGRVALAGPAAERPASATPTSSPPSPPAPPPPPPPPPPPAQPHEPAKRRPAIVMSPCRRVTEGPAPYVGPRGHVPTNAERKVYPPTPPPVPTGAGPELDTTRRASQHAEPEDTGKDEPAEQPGASEQAEREQENHPVRRTHATRGESVPPAPAPTPPPAVPAAEVEDTAEATEGKGMVREEPHVPGSEQEQRRLRLPSPAPPPAKERVPSPAVVRCSVIQRTPTAAVVERKPKEEAQQQHGHHHHHHHHNSYSQQHHRAVDLKVVRPVVIEPEQEQPIDYHIPKRAANSEPATEQATEAEKEGMGRRERQAAILHHHHHHHHAFRGGGASAARAAAAAAVISGIMQGAAGHGRGQSGGGSQSGGAGGSTGGNGGGGGGGGSGGGGGGLSFSGGGGGGGGALGAGGAGGGMGGRDGRSNYGPNSPPTGSLPPFYESLKGGGASGALNGYNANGGFLTNSAASYQQLLSSLECDAQDLAGGTGGGGGAGGVILGLGTGFTYGSASDGSGGAGTGGSAAAAAAAAAVMGKHCTLMLHNHFGLALKDEVDLGYDGKVDPTLHGLYASATGESGGAGGGGGGGGAGGNYDVADSMMDMGDSMQLTATLTTYPSSAGGSPNGLLDGCLSDAEFSLYSRGMHDEQSSNCNDLELTSTPSLTPDSVSASLHQIDTVHDALGGDGYAGEPGGPGAAAHTTHLVLPREYTSMGGFGAPHGGTHHQLHTLAGKYHPGQDGGAAGQPPSYLQTAVNGGGGTGAYGGAPFQPMLRYDQLDSNLSLPSPGGGSSLDFDLHQSLQPLPAPFGMNLQLAGGGGGGAALHLQQHQHQQQQQQVPSSHQRSTGGGGVRSPGGNSTSSVSSSASSVAVASLSAHNVPVAGPPPAVLATTIQNQLGLPADSELQFVNGGHGIKNPLAIENVPLRMRSDERHGAGKQLSGSNGTKQRNHHHHNQQQQAQPQQQHQQQHHHQQMQQQQQQQQYHNMEAASTNSSASSVTSSTSSSASSPNGCGSPGGGATGGNGGICAATTSTDDDQNRFVCRICSKTFSLQRLLNRHMKCHSDVKRYLCTFCAKGFNDTFDLKRHTRTHTGVRPYKCNLCEKSFTQRCSLESHCLKVHGVQHQYAYKERRTKMYVCEECGHTTNEPEVHYMHLKEKHPYSPALLKFYDKRHFKFNNAAFANNLLGSLPMPVHN
uniref:C2H2-type domain-containing protein n=1 Tax=Anopheles dirus TaxID=7168 RepID=A0A182N053_9DIPT